MNVIFFVFCTLILLLIFAASNKKYLREKYCKWGYHIWPKKKYYCVHCGEGRGTMTLIKGQRKDVADFKW